MTLLELLLKKLPEYFTKNGGWPVETDRIIQGATGIIYSNVLSRDNALMRLDVVADDHTNHCVTREQYEAALAAAQQSVWPSEGLPPVGMQCEIVDPDGVLMYGQEESGEVIAHVENTAVIRMSYGLGCFESRFLRPICSEADKKRAEIIEEIAYHTSLDDARDLYEAIAAGQVKGVKLDV